MIASSSSLVDDRTVRAFLEILHAHAARALDGVNKPGLLQLVPIHPSGPAAPSLRFDIGAVERMTEAAVRAANNGFNVYIEARTIAETAPKKGRGGLNDTRGLFAFVVDSDGDKGKAGSLSIEPSLVVESSPGNYHLWLFLERALTVGEARQLGDAIRAGTGADSATGVVTQPYRVPGTPNYPNSKKIARGRVVAPTNLLQHSGRLWTPAALSAAFPAAPVADRNVSGAARKVTGTTASADVHELLSVPATAAMDRSAQFQKAVNSAYREGLSAEVFEQLAAANPQGCAGKYKGRLSKEVERSFKSAERWIQTQSLFELTEPTYRLNTTPITQARNDLKEILEDLFVREYWGPRWRLTGEFWETVEKDAIENPTIYDKCDLDPDFQPLQKAIRVSPGVGKTRSAAYAISKTGSKRFFYSVPTLTLADEICSIHKNLGIDARVFRGRQADNPESSSDKMCLDLQAIEAALKLGVEVSKSCCSGTSPDKEKARCAFYETCGYNQQFEEKPRVWIAAHNILFHEQERLGNVDFVVIDESFWQSGIDQDRRIISIDHIEQTVDPRSELFEYRTKLAKALRISSSLGEKSLRHEHLSQVGLEPHLCVRASKLEWKLLLKERPLWPGMPNKKRTEALQAPTNARHVRTLIVMWEAAGELLCQGMRNPDAVSGRLTVEQAEGEHGTLHVAAVRSVKRVVNRWRRAKTLIMDATLPDLALLRPFYEHLEVLADIDVAMPHVSMRQILGAPVSNNKLFRQVSTNRNLISIKRALLARYIELGRPNTLVVCQKKLEDWLVGTLPSNITVAHFNNISGLDAHKDVQLLFVIGRTLPNIIDVEAMAGALSSIAPAKTRQPEKGPRWYDKVVRGILRKDGQGVRVSADAHPDPVAEACRWQIAEGESIQAIGRGRGVNRAADTPLHIEIWSDLVLPVAVDDVRPWRDIPSGAGIEMLTAGVVLEKPADMSACWPEVWATAAAASECARRERISIPRECSARAIYQRSGVGQKTWKVSYDPEVVGDIRTWLEERLGPLTRFEAVAPQGDS
ncbi:DNA-primase RepB domain-containing protein [Methylobacterium longum]|uniref:DNA-primase RepB domain-containing protein n=1 Tax=Methylobacterium longum TaxID=767694 RepID=A0ABT8ASC9_9HYPH|nr:DNA-primase RepB domain-containing protein [Methylobacterium longum]MDN3572797.1 DNA-primase RepB domain-containing protein [Methylobacterium longum]GJE10080.1 hypothetical protein FOHLNKBM_1112 [Methylobacterium longum]